MGLESESSASQVEALARRLADVERRLAALEESRESSPAAATHADGAGPETQVWEAEEEQPLRLPDVTEVVSFSGRTLVVLGGAFLVRFITESGYLSATAGVAVGLAYAFLWVVLAYRAGTSAAAVSATFHGLAAAMIAYPLLWETTVRFRTVTPMAAALVLAFFGVSLVAVACAADLKALPWLIMSPAALLAMTLAYVEGQVFIFSICLLVLALSSLWFGYPRHSVALGWTMAFVVDAWVLLLTIAVVSGTATEFIANLTPAQLMTLQLAVMVGYLVNCAIRTLLKAQDVTGHGSIQVVVSVLLGLGGAILVARTAGVSTDGLGYVSIGLAVACYLLAFFLLDRRTGVRRNFVFYTSLAFLFTIVGIQTLLSGATLAAVMAGAGLLFSWLGSIRRRATLNVHGVVYIAIAAISAGLPGAFYDAFRGPALPVTRWGTIGLMAVMAASVASTWFPVAEHGRTWRRISVVAKLVRVLLAVMSLGGLLVSLVAVVLPVPSDPDSSSASLAVLRTTVLTLSAFWLLFLSRFGRFAEARLLVFPILVVGALKLAVEDYPYGEPLTLFLSFAIYGSALLWVPRLARRK